MNSAARITTAFRTTGGATARTTAETTLTRRTAVSTAKSLPLVSSVSSFISAADVAHADLDRAEIGHLSVSVSPHLSAASFFSVSHEHTHALPLAECAQPLHSLDGMLSSCLHGRLSIRGQCLFLFYDKKKLHFSHQRKLLCFFFTRCP